MFMLVISPIGSFDLRREASFTGLSNVVFKIFKIQEGVIRKGKTLDLIGIKKFLLELVKRWPV